MPYPTDESQSADPTRPRCSVPPVTRELLERTALGYLNRFDGTEHKLRSVLEAKVRRVAAEHEVDADAARRMIDALMARYRESGLVDDLRFARSAVQGLRQRGASSRRILHKLREKGVDPQTIERALAENDAPAADAELEAARAYARRRRLTRTLDSPEGRRRAMAALARAGFGYATVRAALELADEPEWE